MGAAAARKPLVRRAGFRYSRGGASVDPCDMSPFPRRQRLFAALVLVLLPLGSPSAQEAPTRAPDAAPQLDVIKLRNESLIEGVILGETETTLTIRLDAGQELELD